MEKILRMCGLRSMRAIKQAAQQNAREGAISQRIADLESTQAMQAQAAQQGAREEMLSKQVAELESFSEGSYLSWSLAEILYH